MEKSNHKNIVKYFGHFSIDKDTTGIAMELCQGTLKDLVKARELNLLEVAFLSRQMLIGIEYLHDVLKIHHR